MKIHNPLTIIAIFSGMAETFATGALILLPPDSQKIFIYFVMFFPIVLVVLFFRTLKVNPNSLYGPGDFKDQNHYVEMQRMFQQEVTPALFSLTSKLSNDNEDEVDRDQLFSDVSKLNKKIRNVFVNYEAASNMHSKYTPATKTEINDFQNLTEYQSSLFEKYSLERKVLSFLARNSGKAYTLSSLSNELDIEKNTVLDALMTLSMGRYIEVIEDNENHVVKYAAVF